MKILVTGSRGFLGKFLCPRLIAEGHEVIGVHSENCDLRCLDSLTQFKKTRFDRIFHLAAWTQAGNFCLSHPGEQWIINQEINTNVLTWWKDAQPQAKLICMGTSCAYDPHLPLIEENYLVGKPIDSLFIYAMTKRMLLTGAMALHQQFGLEYLCLVPSTLYGPLYHTDGRQMHFIFDLIRKILRGHLYGEEVILWGDGQQKRELVHVRDFVEAMLYLTDQHSNMLVNVGAGKEYSIRQFAQMICDHVGYPTEKIIYDTSQYVGARSKTLSINKLQKLVPTYRTSDLRKGIAETADWMLQHKDQLLGGVS